MLTLQHKQQTFNNSMAASEMCDYALMSFIFSKFQEQVIL